MDAETLIYVLAFVFFVLPSILRRLGKKTGPDKDKKPVSFLPGKLKDKVQGVLKELERQVQAARDEAKPREMSPDRPGQLEPEEASIWDRLDDRDRSETPVFEEKAPAFKPAPGLYDPDHSFVAPEKSDRMATARKPVSPSPAPAKPVAQSLTVRAALPSHALQQAVVWSEILGPPKGLQD